MTVVARRFVVAQKRLEEAIRRAQELAGGTTTPTSPNVEQVPPEEEAPAA